MSEEKPKRHLPDLIPPRDLQKELKDAQRQAAEAHARRLSQGVSGRMWWSGGGSFQQQLDEELNKPD